MKPCIAHWPILVAMLAGGCSKNHGPKFDPAYRSCRVTVIGGVNEQAHTYWPATVPMFERAYETTRVRFISEDGGVINVPAERAVIEYFNEDKATRLKLDPRPKRNRLTRKASR